MVETKQASVRQLLERKRDELQAGRLEIYRAAQDLERAIQKLRTAAVLTGLGDGLAMQLRASYCELDRLHGDVCDVITITQIRERTERAACAGGCA